MYLILDNPKILCNCCKRMTACLFSAQTLSMVENCARDKKDPPLQAFERGLAKKGCYISRDRRPRKQVIQARWRIPVDSYVA